jgi:class 3 adenylate cyclase
MRAARLEALAVSAGAIGFASTLHEGLPLRDRATKNF